MSFRALLAALDTIRTVPVSASARLVLIALANRHNQETGRCDPSNETIRKDTQLSERAVRAALRELEEKKLISTTHRLRRTGRGKKNLTNRYVLKINRKTSGRGHKHNRGGGAGFAGGMGQDLPPNLEHIPSAFYDLATAIDICDDEDATGGDTVA